MKFDNMTIYCEPEYIIVTLYGTTEEKQRHAELLELIFSGKTEPAKLIEYHEEIICLTEQVKRRELTKMACNCGWCCEHFKECRIRKRLRNKGGAYCCGYCSGYNGCLSFFIKFKDKFK